MHAIPTKYAGVQFRSRLEARWAAFFDLLEWPWEYEPFDLPGWIPDFKIDIPNHQWHISPKLVEIKPTRSDIPAAVVKAREAVKASDLGSEYHSGLFLSGDIRFIDALFMFQRVVAPNEDPPYERVGGCILGVEDWFKFGPCGNISLSQSSSRWCAVFRSKEIYDDLITLRHSIPGTIESQFLDTPPKGENALRMMWREAQNKVQWKAPV